MATLTYNNVSIALTRTLGVAHEAIRDDDGTYLHTRVIIDVEGMVAGRPSESQNAPSSPPAVATTLGAPISDAMEFVRHALLMERRPLVYDVGDRGEPLITAPQLDGDGVPYPCDVANGPLPGPLTIWRVDGISAFHVRYRVTCHLLECPGYAGEGPPALISNRYEQAHSIDGSTHLTVIHTTGEARFRTDILESQRKGPDSYRDVLIPPTPRGFRLARLDVWATSTRDRLRYAVTHEERTFDLGDTGPNGSNSRITDVRASYSVSSTGQAGAPVSLITAHSVDVTVLGSKAADPWTLVKACFTVAQSKLPITDPTRGFLTHIAVRQSLTDRSASLTATMLLSKEAAAQIPGIDVGGLRDNSTFAPRDGINPSLPGRGGTAGSYANEAMAAAWKSACAVPRKPYEGEVAPPSAADSYSADTGPVVTATVTDNLPSLPQGYSYEQTHFPFTQYQVDSVLVTDTGVMAVPNSGPIGPYSAGGGYVGGGASGGDTPDAVFLTVARPTQRKVVEWTAERVGAPPIAPSPVPQDANLVLIDSGHVQQAEPNILADGVTVAYRVSGRYVYGLKKNRKASDPLPFPAPPWQAHAYGELAMQPTDFQAGIIDRSSSGYAG